MGFLKIDETKIFYREVGQGDITLFFVHGNSSSSNSFIKQFESKLADRFRLIAIDLPGHGNSDPLSQYSVSKLTDCIAGCFKALNLSSRSVIGVGHSFGGHLLLEASPQLGHLRSMVIWGTPPLGNPARPDIAFQPNPNVQYFFMGELSDLQIESAALELFAEGTPLSRAACEEMRNTDPKFRPGIGQSLQTGDFLDELKIVAELPYPLVIFHGKKDKLVNGEYFQEFQISAKVQIFEHSGHCPHIEESEKFNTLLMQLG